MLKLPKESESCVVVQSPHNDDSGNLDYKRGLKLCAILLAGLTTWRIAWPLISMVVVNQGLVFLALLVFFAAACVPFYCFSGWLMGSPLEEGLEKDAKSYRRGIHHWVISERSVKVYYANHFHRFSMNSVKSCEVKDQHLQITYLSNQVDQLPLDGFSTETQLQAAQALLSAGPAIDAGSLEPLKNAIEIESSYSKEALKTLKAHCPIQRHSRMSFYRRTVAFAVTYLIFIAADAVVNGKPLFASQHLLTVAAFVLPEALTHWMTSGNAEATRHFWRINMDGFRFGFWSGESHCETCRQWSDLQELTETREGLLLKFEHPSSLVLLPKDTISLLDWNESVEAIRMLSEKEIVAADQTSALEPPLVEVHKCLRTT